MRITPHVFFLALFLPAAAPFQLTITIGPDQSVPYGFVPLTIIYSQVRFAQFSIA